MSDGGDERRAQQAELYPEPPIWPPAGTFQCMTQREAADYQAKHPFRHLSVVGQRRPARVEAAHCGWCRFRKGIDCEHPVSPTNGTHLRTRSINPHGECPHWEPSWWTRVLRMLGGRAPVMVDPRVWDKEEADHGH